MKKNVINIFLFVGLLGLTYSCNNAPKAGEAVEVQNASSESTQYLVNVNDSEIEWTASKIAYSHNGDLKLKNGEIFVKDNKIEAARFVIDMNSINVEDLEGEKKAALEGHLKGIGDVEKTDHFFNVEKYPEGSFELSSISKKGTKEYVTGNLTLKGITKSVTFPAQIKISDNEISIDSEEFSINRTDWNINFGSKKTYTDLAADNIISDEIKIEVDVKATR